jgi:hypothetical protein
MEFIHRVDNVRGKLLDMYQQRVEVVAQRSVQLEGLPEMAREKGNQLLSEVEICAAKRHRSFINKSKRGRFDEATIRLNDAMSEFDKYVALEQKRAQF